MKIQKTLGKVINEKINEKFRATKDADVLNWIDAGSSAEVNGAAYSPGAASRVTTAPRNPHLTLHDDELLLAFRAECSSQSLHLAPPALTVPLFLG